METDGFDLATLITKIVVALIIAIGSFIKGIRFVHEGERGVKLRFGRAIRDETGHPRIYEPGFTLLIPFVDTLRRRHVRQQTRHFPYQRIKLKDGLIFNVEAVILFRVKDIYKALFDVDDLDTTVDDMGMTIARDEISSCTHSELEHNGTISERLLTQIKPFAEQIGIEVIRFGLTDCAPTAETANLLNAETAVRLRLQALKKACEAEKTSWNRLNPTLAAALIGIPLTATVGVEHSSVPQTAGSESKEED